jgi:hypothetical protein
MRHAHLRDNLRYIYTPAAHRRLPRWLSRLWAWC